MKVKLTVVVVLVIVNTGSRSTSGSSVYSGRMVSSCGGHSGSYSNRTVIHYYQVV